MTDDEMVKHVSPELVNRAHEWWNELPSRFKAHCSIWFLLALFADYMEKERTP